METRKHHQSKSHAKHMHVEQQNNQQIKYKNQEKTTSTKKLTENTSA
jgi:hypothetical protein